MDINIEVENVEFSEELYQKNLQENCFADLDEFDGVGGDENADNEC